MARPQFICHYLDRTQMLLLPSLVEIRAIFVGFIKFHDLIMPFPHFLKPALNPGHVIDKFEFVFTRFGVGLFVDFHQSPVHHRQKYRSSVFEEMVQRPSRNTCCLDDGIDTDFLVCLFTKESLAGVQNIVDSINPSSLRRLSFHAGKLEWFDTPGIADSHSPGREAAGSDSTSKASNAFPGVVPRIA